MLLQQYQKEIEKFVQYPSVGYKGIVYPALGLANEVGELVELLLSDNCEFTNLLSEGGDVLFYATRCASHLGYDLPEIQVKDYDDDSAAKAILQLVIWSGNLTGYVKKALRDGESGEARLQSNAPTCILGILENLSIFVYPVSLGDVAKLNTDKLDGRLSRGTIKGSGHGR